MKIEHVIIHDMNETAPMGVVCAFFPKVKQWFMIFWQETNGWNYYTPNSSNLSIRVSISENGHPSHFFETNHISP